MKRVLVLLALLIPVVAIFAHDADDPTASSTDLLPRDAEEPTASSTDLVSRVVGTYRRLPVTNTWHVGEIRAEKHGGMRWINKARATWTLTASDSGDSLETGPANPYRKNGNTAFHLVRKGDGIQGFLFGGELYVREGVALLAPRAGGLHGYISASVAAVPPEFGRGVSFYAAVWSLLEEPVGGLQIGLPSTWIIPENRTFTKPLCPPGTMARDNWPERGPTWRDVFQTIEGGLGFWRSTRFPSKTPKYRIGGTANGYTPATPPAGRSSGWRASLNAAEAGVAQISNRLLVAPDGLTFRGTPNGELIGNAWMALPLVPAHSRNSTPTGDQSWTLFLETATFRGPVAFWIPDVWSQLSEGYPAIRKRGLDARPGVMGAGAMEVNSVPSFEAEDARGRQYSRIPRIRFPVDDEGRTILMQDVTMYSRETLWDPLAAWFIDGKPATGRFRTVGNHRPALRASPLRLRQPRNKLVMSGLDARVETRIFEFGDSRAFGLQWSDDPNRGRLPEYWERHDTELLPVDAPDVPAETKLRDQAFDPPRGVHSYDAPSGTPQNGNIADPRLGPFTADLSDGSRVTYAWYRFVDQPSVRAAAWTRETRRIVQERVEAIHRTWASDGRYMHPASRGELAELDPALILVPPRGFEVGYVPIAISQSVPKHR